MAEETEQKPEPVAPKINDQFWFNYSEKMVNGAVETIEKAASKMQNLVIWLWGIYTAGAAVGLSLAEKQLPWWQAGFIAVTSAFLIAVYWTTIWVQQPVKTFFDPRSPDEIEKAFAKNILEKSKRMRITLILSVMAAFMVSLALLVASIGEIKTPKPAAGLNAALSQAGANSLLEIAGNAPGTQFVTLEILPGAPHTPLKYTLKTGADGLIRTTIPLKPPVKKVEILLQWIGTGGVEYRLSKKIGK